MTRSRFKLLLAQDSPQARALYRFREHAALLLALPVLRWIIQQGGAAIQEIASSMDRGREALENVRELAERSVKSITNAAEQRKPEKNESKTHIGAGRSSKKRGLLEEILELPQRRLEELQLRVDSQVRGSIERVASHPAVKRELQRIEKNLRQLEGQIALLRGRPVVTGEPSSKSRRKAKSGVRTRARATS